MLKLNSVLSVLHTYTYHYQSVSDTYKENPLSLYYNTYDKSIYIAGNIISQTNLSATLLIKLNSGTDALAWKKVSAFSTGKNSFNSVRTSSSLVYAAGSRNDSVSKTYMQVQSYNYAGKASKMYSFYDAISKAQKFTSTEAIKITLADLGVRVVSIAKDSSSQKCDVILSFIKSDLSSATIFKVAMPYNTGIGDAATNQQSLYNLITGYKAVGSNKNMFVLGFDEGGTLNYRDSIVSRSASGNSITFPNAFDVWVTGFEDLKSKFALPDDEYFTRHYFDTGIIGFNRVSANENYMLKSKTGINETSIFPNPAHDKINIISTEAIKEVKLYNEAGALVLHQELPGINILQYVLNINLLPVGAYILKVNSKSAYKIIKQ